MSRSLAMLVAMLAPWVPGAVPANDDFDGDLDALIGEEQDWGSAKNAEPQRLTLRVNGVSGKPGKINVMVFDEPIAFSNYDFLAAAGLAEAPASRGTVQIEIPVSGTGPYAVFAFHDENDDKRLNMTNGKPQEGYGYSGGIDPYRPPSFEQSAIVEDQADIRLTYFRKDLRLSR